MVAISFGVNGSLDFFFFPPLLLRLFLFVPPVLTDCRKAGSDAIFRGAKRLADEGMYGRSWAM